VVEVVYVSLYEAFCHVRGLTLIIVRTMLFLCVVIHGVLVVGIRVCALDYPVSVCDLAHAILK